MGCKKSRHPAGLRSAGDAPSTGPEMSMNFAQARCANLFATPLVTYVLDDVADLNASLRERILAHRAERPGIGKSNRGGWHSAIGQLEFCGDAGELLVSYMRALGDEAT